MSNDMVVFKYGRGRGRRKKNTSFDIKRIANRVMTWKRITFDIKPLSLIVIIIMLKSRLPWR